MQGKQQRLIFNFVDGEMRVIGPETPGGKANHQPMNPAEYMITSRINDGSDIWATTLLEYRGCRGFRNRPRPKQ